LRERFPNDYEVLGTDVASGALDVAENKGVPVLRENFFTLKGSNRFEVITFWAVLEHVGEPAEFLRKAHELLAEDGYCFVLEPNIRSLA
jgi:2-polyprenyl-3-methyl-5-hydroxy-6-metoxy-1,4-benzoquinol methylase